MPADALRAGLVRDREASAPLDVSAEAAFGCQEARDAAAHFEAAATGAKG